MPGFKIFTCVLTLHVLHILDLSFWADSLCMTLPVLQGLDLLLWTDSLRMIWLVITFRIHIRIIGFMSGALSQYIE